MPETISDAIAADHASFDEYADYLRTATDDAERIKWRNQLTWTVARHALSEELTLYPAMEKHLGEEGKKLTKTDKEQHQAVKDTLYQLQDMSPSDLKFMPLLNELMENLHHHIEHEKNEDMPRLEGLVSREESEAIAKSFQRTKGIVPTRSHPAAPTEFYAESLVGLLTAPIDRLQDWLRDFPDDKDVENAKARM